jgi:pimeloyl-ACP methyl ester carboxylesterase
VLIDSQLGVDPAEAIEGYRGMIGHWMSDEPLGDVGQYVAGLILGQPELSATWIELWEQRRGPHIELAGAALLERDDISDRAAELTMPVLSVHGEDDQAIGIEHAEALQAQVPDGRGLVRVPGGAHAPNMTHPEIVNSGIAAFLATL